MEKIKIAFIPLDNRPVSYSLPLQIGYLSANTEVFIPPREYIGGLTHNTDIDQVLLWLNKILEDENISLIVCSLDSIVYGGLIPSRRSSDKEEIIKSRIDKFEQLIQKYKKEKNLKLYAFSSIMRVSNNNYNEEEKEYWNKYGELIFKYSYLTDKISESPDLSDQEELKDAFNLIPGDILEDYIQTRQRNSNINKYYLDLVKNDLIDFMVFSQDDTAKYGFNVQESKILKDLIIRQNLESRINVQTGADEIPSDLLIRGILEYFSKKILIYPIFSTESGRNVISRYEDRTIEASVFGQINLCGAKVANSPEEADVLLLVHTPIVSQNDHCMAIHTEIENFGAINYCISIIKDSKKPVLIADVACANGADNLLVKSLLGNGLDLSKIYSYAGWNTTGNTLGTAISTGLSRYFAEKTQSFNFDNFKKLLLVRFADDWAYQTVVRQKIRAITSEADTVLLDEELRPFVLNLAKKIDLHLSELDLSFPWNRTFEVEINL
ncbi:MAG: DUF4127 family protein [Candidatus Gastranaerophilales bacterium]|nr:DUF4127 family protein [Candidatus Gastranaerophilales bacterium]